LYCVSVRNYVVKCDFMHDVMEIDNACVGVANTFMKGLVY